MNYKTNLTKFDIVSKEGQSVPFVPNNFQQLFLDNMTGKDIVLKSRQIGFSSLLIGIFTVDFLLKENSRSVVISCDSKSAEKLLDRVKYFIKSAEDKGLSVNLKYNNRNELLNSDKNSSFYIGAAGSKTFGRGDTISNCLLDEFAFYPDPETTVTSIFQSVIPSGRTIILSTANGINYFKTYWDRSKEGLTGFKCHFFDNSFYDQKFLDAKRAESGDRAFKQEYPSNDTECFLYSGDPYFDMDSLKTYLERATPPIKKGDFIGLYPPIFEETESGFWSIWELPKDGHQYILSADVAERRDYAAGIMLDRSSFKVVATFHGHLEAGLYGDELNKAGRYYHEALIAPEKNNQGLSVIQRLRDLNYPNLYTRQVVDSITKNEGTDIGWLTTSATRPLMLANLQTIIRQKTLNLPDAETIKELMSFVRNDKGRPEAVLGSHDDYCIALAIACQVYQTAPQQQQDFSDLPDDTIWLNEKYGF